MQKLHLVLKIMTPLIVGLFFIAVVSITGLYFLQKNNIHAVLNDTFEQTLKIMDEKIEDEVILFEGFALFLQEDERIKKYFTHNKKRELEEYLQPIYQRLKMQYDITHISFISPQKEEMVCVHEDDHQRVSNLSFKFKRAPKSIMSSSGIEFGAFNKLFLRVTTPWYDNGELIGYIQMYESMDRLMPELSSLLGGDIILTIRKSAISQKEYEECVEQNRCKDHMVELQNSYIIDSTLKQIGDELAQRLGSVNNSANYSVQNGENKLYILSECLVSMAGEKIGRIFVLIDTKREFVYMYMLIIKITLIVAVLVLFMFIYYYKYIKKTETKLNEAHEKIMMLSLTDPLTGLYNKRYFNQNAPMQLKRSQRCGSYLSFMIVDVDNFKAYNDTYGHLAGDDILKRVGRTIKKTFKRANDEVYRVGGEEFAVIIDGQDESLGERMAERLRQRVEQLDIKHSDNNGYGRLTVSIGICTQQIEQDTTIDELYNNADRAMYCSKQNGRNRITMYSKEEK